MLSPVPGQPLFRGLRGTGNSCQFRMLARVHVLVAGSLTWTTPRRRCQQSGSLSCGAVLGCMQQHTTVSFFMAAWGERGQIRQDCLSISDNKLFVLLVKPLGQLCLVAVHSEEVLPVSRYGFCSHPMSARSFSTLCSCTAFQ